MILTGTVVSLSLLAFSMVLLHQSMTAFVLHVDLMFFNVLVSRYAVFDASVTLIIASFTILVAIIVFPILKLVGGRT